MNTRFEAISKHVRHGILTSTSEAGSGHPTSSLSAVELTTVLFFGGYFKQDSSDFKNPLNDKFVLSKGHAAPLLYSLYEAAGVLTEKELLSLRKFDSHLQGHPTPEVPFVDVTTGSLGQGLSVGVGMALGLQKRFKTLGDKMPKVFVLLGDSEFAEGQNYEALQIASYYKLNNLVAILDVNRLGQRGETQLGWDLETYKKRVESFGWNTVVINDGNSIDEVQKAYAVLNKSSTSEKPMMFIAKTKKGAGISFLADKDNWHGKAVPKNQLEAALKELGDIDFSVKGIIEKPGVTNLGVSPTRADSRTAGEHWRGNDLGQNLVSSPISTREAYGYALADLAKQNKNIIALDAETSNSTYAEFVKKETPDQFVECFIAEQNMVSMALGLSKVGYIPFASSFAAFLTRAFDQIRMSQYSNPSLTVVGSHAGCSIGVDGASQMALEDISMMRSVGDSTVLYPSDAISTYRLTEELVGKKGVNYLRTTREKTPILYGKDEEFPIGGLKIHAPKKDGSIKAVIIAAGITLHEALKAQKLLEEKEIYTTVVDLYSVKPLDTKTLLKLAGKTNHFIIVEDHHEEGGIGEAVFSALSMSNTQLKLIFTHLCVRKEPRSGTPEELMKYEEINAEAITKVLVK